MLRARSPLEERTVEEECGLAGRPLYYSRYTQGTSVSRYGSYMQAAVALCSSVATRLLYRTPPREPRVPRPWSPSVPERVAVPVVVICGVNDV